MHNIYIPFWISTRIYETADNETTAYISNEKYHYSCFLKGEGARIWKLITQNHNAGYIRNYAKKNGCGDELNDFIKELEKFGLLKADENKSYLNSSNINIPNNSREEEFQCYDNIISWYLKNRFMYRLFVELTNNCNLNCVHCLNTKGSQELDFKQVKKVIDEAYELGVFNITISGGECTLNKDFLKIARYIREKKLQLDFFTNGQLLYDDNNFFNNVLSLYPHSVSLSLYSMDPDIHDSITGVKGSQHKTVSVIKNLIANNVFVIIKCFLTKLNADSYPEVQEFAKKTGASITLDCYFLNNPEKNISCVKITDSQMFKIFSDNNSLLKAKNISTEIDETYLNRNICTSGIRGLSIGSDYNIYGCIISKFLLGNAENESMIDIWNDKNPNSPFNKIKHIKNRDRIECFKYDYCKYCTYCPGETNVNGKFLKKYDNFCRYARIRMKAANALTPGRK